MELPARSITTYLTTHPGSHCADCLARAIGLPAGQVSMVMRRLREAGDFRTETGSCTDCRRKVSVIRAGLAG